MEAPHASGAVDRMQEEGHVPGDDKALPEGDEADQERGDAQTGTSGAVEETPKKETSAEPAFDDVDEGDVERDRNQDRHRVEENGAAGMGPSSPSGDVKEGGADKMLVDEAAAPTAAATTEERKLRRSTRPRRRVKMSSEDEEMSSQTRGRTGASSRSSSTSSSAKRGRNRRGWRGRGSSEVADSDHEELEETKMPEEDVDEEEQDEEGSNDGEDDSTIRSYIRQRIKRSGGISTENVRKTFGIGWIRAKRLHDQEMGLKSPDEVRYASDDSLRRYIRRCFDEKGTCSVNHLRQEFNVGYNRAKKILEEEKERAEDGEQGGEAASMTAMGAVAEQLLGLGMGDDSSAVVKEGEKRQKRHRRAKDHGRQSNEQYQSNMTNEEVRMQGLEEDASYLLGLAMDLHVAHRERNHRTEDEAICENALQSLSSASSKASGHSTIKSRDVSAVRKSHADTRQAIMERSREELQRQLEDVRLERKRLQGSTRNSSVRRQRKQEEKALEAALGADMEKIKAKLNQIFDLRDTLEEEIGFSRRERELALRAAGRPSASDSRDGDTATPEKRKRNEADQADEDNIAERMHRLLQTLADLQQELEEEHRSFKALPPTIGLPEPLAGLASKARLTSSLLTSCLLSLTVPSASRAESSHKRASSASAHVGPSSSSSSASSSASFAPPSPLPVTFTYSVPALSSQEFIKSLEALTSSSVPSALSSFSSSGSLSFTIPRVPPPSLASSLSFTSLPPPSPLLTYLPPLGDGLPGPLPALLPDQQNAVFLPPPPLPTIPIASFPVFPYADYVVVGGDRAQQPHEVAAKEGQNTTIAASVSPNVKRATKRRKKEHAGALEEMNEGEEGHINKSLQSTPSSESRSEGAEDDRSPCESDDSLKRKRGRSRKNEGKSK